MGQAFEVFGEPAAAAEPADGAFDNPALEPALGDDFEALRRIGAVDNFDFELCDGPASGGLEDRPGITAVSEQRFEESPASEQRGKHKDAAVAVLDAGGVDDGVEQKPYRIDQDVALLALDLFARIVAAGVRTPPFLALFTLWLSMIAAVGEAWRPACSRQAK